MAVYSSSDIRAFFSDAATDLIYRRGKTRFNVRGILDSPYQAVAVVDPEFSSERIALTIPSASLPKESAEGDKIINGQDIYTVREIQPDGTGVTVLVLEATTDLSAPA
jgi:hypothetical protein